ncbi:hypothetical protein [Oerskovia flava]|uniref:hypothetical protein n=1 Tax=Oerskovia flava TaxID=2986422 RepID=UPI0022403DBD|nr:hypothetical protein [Oerskovia sp. JB1-3-2]
MNRPEPLLATDVAVWRRRPRTRRLALIAAAVPVLLLAALVILEEDDGSGYPATLVEDPSYWMLGVVFGLALAGVATAFALPGATPWLAAGTCALLATTAPADAREGMVVVWGLALLCAAPGIADLIGVARQRTEAAGWPGASAPPVVPVVAPAIRAELYRLRAARLAFPALCALGGIAAVWYFAAATTSAQEFRATATVATGTVTALDDDALEADIEVDGRRFTISTEGVERVVGEQVGVRYDAAGRAEAVDDVDDPSGALLLAAGLLLAPVLLVREIRRRDAVRRILRDGGVAHTVLATWNDGQLLLVTADGDRPVARVRDVVGLQLVPEPEAVSSESRTERPVADVDDDELLRLAVELAHGEQSDEAPDASQAPDRWHRTPVTVVGLVADGLPVALRGPDGAWYVSEVGVLRPATSLSRDLASDQSTPEQPTPPDAGTAGSELGHGPRAGAAEDAAGPVLRLAVATGTVGPWLTVPAVAVLAAWWGTELHLVGLLFGTVLVWSALGGWAWLAEPSLRITPRALVSTGRHLDEHVPWIAVEDVAADGQALVVRVRETATSEADAIMVAPPSGFDVLPGTTDPRTAREAILAARRRSTTAAAPDQPLERIPRRPSRATLVGAAGAVAAVTGVVLGGGGAW